jgi:hypothetical protein
MSVRWLGPLALVTLALVTLGASSTEAAAYAGLRVVAAEGSAGLAVEVPGAAPYPAESAGGVASYALLRAGPARVTLVAATPPDAPEAPRVELGTIDVQLEAGAFYTLVVSGLDAGAGAGGAVAGGAVAGGVGAGGAADASAGGDGAATAQPPVLATALMLDEIEALPRAGHASLRIAHAAPSGVSVSVEIRVHDPDGWRGASDRGDDEEGGAEREPFVVEIEPLRSSARFDLPEGAYDLMVSEAGMAVGDRRPLALALRSGVAYTLYVSGVSPESAIARLVIDAAMPAPPQRTRD